MKQWDVKPPQQIRQQDDKKGQGGFLKAIFKLIFALAAIFFVSLYLDHAFETKTVISVSGSARAPSFSNSLPAALVDFTFAKEEPLEGEFSGRINFLLLGMPGEGNPAPYLTDTIIFASFFPETKKIYLVSLPRDILVRIPETEKFARINSLYLYGLLQQPAFPFGSILKKAEEVTGQNINYYALIDLNLFKKTVDALGGIEVFVEKDIFDAYFPGDNFSYETFSLKQGFQVLDGETAAKYARTRHSVFGDFDRVKRQKEVIQSIIGKIQNLNPVFDFKTYIDLYNSFRAHFSTNLTYSDLKRFYSLIKDLSGKNIFEYTVGIFEPTKFLKEYSNGGYYLVPLDGIEDYGKIQQFFASFTP